MSGPFTDPTVDVVLQACDMHAVDKAVLTDDPIDIYNVDGDLQFQLSVGANASDLTRMLRYANRRYDEGRARGVAEAREMMVNALGLGARS